MGGVESGFAALNTLAFPPFADQEGSWEDSLSSYAK